MTYGDLTYGEYVYSDDDHLGESWEYILGFPEYRVSDLGRVWSYISNWFIKPYPMNGYHLGVRLVNFGERRSFYVHRLVAEAFIPNPHGHPMVLHWDDDPENNVVDNLRWGTQGENIRDAVRNGNRPGCAPVSIRATHIDGTVKEFESQHEASRRLNVSVAGISKWADTDKSLKDFYFERLH